MQSSLRRRLITRSNFDGLVCAVLLKHLNLVDEILFVHPKDMQDSMIPVSGQDITANLPYVAGVHLAFDNHVSESLRRRTHHPEHVLDATAPSTARVIFDHFGGIYRFPAAFDDMLAAVDKAEARGFSIDDVLHPKGWELLSFLMDARTGLGRFRSFRISNLALMRALVEHCTNLDIDHILELDDVRERVDLYFAHEVRFQDQVRRCTDLHGDLAVVDLREEPILFAGNRYMVFALAPQCSSSLHIFWGRHRHITVFAANHSLFNHRNQISIGELMLRYGGGGHRAAGPCQVDTANAAKVRGEIIEQLRTDWSPEQIRG